MHRRAFAARIAALGVASPLFPDLVFARATEGPITAATIREAESLAGIVLTDAQRARMVDDLQDMRRGLDAVSALNMPNSVPPSVRFDPFTPPGVAPRTGTEGPTWNLPAVARPSNETDLAFLGVAGLAHLVRTRQVTSTELTDAVPRTPAPLRPGAQGRRDPDGGARPGRRPRRRCRDRGGALPGAAPRDSVRRQRPARRARRARRPGARPPTPRSGSTRTPR